MRLVNLKRHLPEAVKLDGYYAKQYEQFFNVNLPVVRKLLDEESAYDIIAEAKDGDAIALTAVYALAERMAVAKFYREPCSFLGPNPKAWRKRSDEELEKYFDIVEDAIDKALAAISMNKLDKEKAEQGLQYYVRGYIMRSNQQYHDSTDDAVTDSVDNPDFVTRKDSGLAVDDNSERSILSAGLKQLSKDPEWHGGKYDVGAIFKDFMISGDLQATSDKFGVAKNTLRYKVFPEIVKLFDKHGIDKAKLAQAYHSDPSIVASL